MAFDIRDLQKGRGPIQARSKADEGRAVLKYIDVDDLVPSEDNFYSMSAIDELAGLIELSGGVKQPGLVAPLGGGKYKVISGHRRRLASLRLVKQGKEAYRKMPCMVDAGEREPGEDADELRAIDEAILLIATNSQREKTDWDKVQEATRLRALLERKRRFEKIPGETRKLIAEQLGTTPSQVGRYDSIEKHLIPAFKDLLAEGKIGISVAYDLSTLPEDVQQEAEAEFRAKREPIALEDVRKWKQAEREPEKKPPESGAWKTASRAEDVPPPPPAPAKPAKIMQAAKDMTEPEPAEKPRDRPSERACAMENTEGKVVDFPSQPAPPPSEAAQKPEKEPLSTKQAADILEDLQAYCGKMLAAEAEREKTWAERCAALAVAIAALRK